MSLSVSIIVPVYNVENYIKDCFMSVSSQNYQGPTECLFIDDCGTDNSIEILEGLIQVYDGPIEMRLIHHEKNGGLSAARNTGITNSTSDYIFFLDSDDQIYPDTIDCLLKAAIKEDNPDMVLGGYQVSIPDHPINRYRYEYRVLKGQPLIAKEFLSDRLFCMAPNKLVGRDFITVNDLWFKEGIIHEDNLWSFQSFHLAEKVVTVSDITYYYNLHDESIMSSSKLERRLESCEVIFDEVMKDINSGRYKPIGKESIQYVRFLIDNRCFQLINQLYENSDLDLKTRLHQLAVIHESYLSLFNKYWLSPTPFLKLLKMTFKFRLFLLFDLLMRMSKSNKRNI